MIKITNPLFYNGRIYEVGDLLQLSNEFEENIVENNNGEYVNIDDDIKSNNKINYSTDEKGDIETNGRIYDAGDLLQLSNEFEEKIVENNNGEYININDTIKSNNKINYSTDEKGDIETNDKDDDADETQMKFGRGLNNNA